MSETRSTTPERPSQVMSSPLISAPMMMSWGLRRWFVIVAYLGLCAFTIYYIFWGNEKVAAIICWIATPILLSVTSLLRVFEPDVTGPTDAKDSTIDVTPMRDQTAENFRALVAFLNALAVFVLAQTSGDGRRLFGWHAIVWILISGSIGMVSWIAISRWGNRRKKALEARRPEIA